ncbi:hypothetical protein FKR81_04845 [Lentzea tibetensis]|uniref:Uncharacterized protein n=1 Tax=Lentzea tibetensis TaxID=2591470 RepID=A0A563F0I7_9PSEU|nr:hypothetical protein [Lentzea tibetensis]TWP53302.1 hypothetical protein FKR81_04845 [Lentzea tibetensis]
MARNHLKAVVIGAGLFAIAACSAQPDEPRPEPPLGPVPVIQVDADVTFPLDGYLISPERRATVRKGQDLLVQKCLRRFGFEMELPDREADQVRGRVIGVVDDAEVAKYGYSDPETLESVHKAEQIRKDQKPWPEEMVAVLNGRGQNASKKGDVPQGGCAGEAQRALGLASQSVDKPGDENFVIALSRDSTKLTEEDSRLKGAWGKWSACMKEAGYDYADPWGPNGEKKFGGDDASPEEIATARADVACRKKHDVNGIWVAVRTAYQNRLIEDNADALKQHQNRIDEQVRKATEVVSAKK